VHSFQVCITSTSILASLRCTCFDIARQIFSTPCRHSGQNPHRPSRTLRPTDRNNLEINGGDDVDEDGPVKPRLARSAILQASSMISDYLATENDPFAQEFEELLGTFSRRLHLDAAKSMKNTVLTDFFRTHNTTDLE
jgi:hypothetical protein